MELESSIENIVLDGEPLYRIKAPIPPYGSCFLVSENSSAASRSNLIAIANQWAELWPAMLNFIESEGHEYGCDSQFSGAEEDDGEGILSVGVGAIREGEYLADKANILVSIEFDEPPLWTFFIMNNQIVDAQPVF